MAKVPKSEGHRGGISAFVLPYDTEGVTVEHRNAFMGLRGIENSVTKLENVYVPAENRIGKEGEGLKIALTTLNTGRLALPAICLGAAKWATKVAREYAAERVQWGQPVGKHDAVAQKIAFIAGSAFGLEAMLDVGSRLADDKKNDFRIEAAILKLYASEIGWQITDELMQIRGGRGYETAESLKARGEKAVPVEQVMRDMRINRIFEGSTEIMHLLIAREAVDQHLSVAGDILDPDTEIKDKAKSAVAAGAFYGKWLPQLAAGKGQNPGSYDEFGDLAKHVRFAERASRKLARSTFYGMSRWQAGLEKRQAWLGRIVDIGAELFAISSAVVYANTLAEERPERAEQARELADLFCTQARRRANNLFRDLWQNDDDENHAAALKVLDGPLRPDRGGRAGPLRRRPDGGRPERGARAGGRLARGPAGGRRRSHALDRRRHERHRDAARRLVARPRRRHGPAGGPPRAVRGRDRRRRDRGLRAQAPAADPLDAGGDRARPQGRARRRRLRDREDRGGPRRARARCRW